MYSNTIKCDCGASVDLDNTDWCNACDKSIFAEPKNNNMENKQTAVDFLYERLERMIPRTISYDIDKRQYLQQAKEIEKEQIKNAWLSGQDDGATICTPNQHYPDEQYYNETYESNT